MTDEQVKKAEDMIKKDPDMERVYKNLFGKDWKELLKSTDGKGNVSSADYFRCADKDAVAYSKYKLKKDEEKALRKFGDEIK